MSENVYGSVALLSPNWDGPTHMPSDSQVRKWAVVHGEKEVKPQWILEHNAEWEKMLENMCGVILFPKS